MEIKCTNHDCIKKHHCYTYVFNSNQAVEKTCLEGGDSCSKFVYLKHRDHGQYKRQYRKTCPTCGKSEVKHKRCETKGCWSYGAYMFCGKHRCEDKYGKRIKT